MLGKILSKTKYLSPVRRLFSENVGATSNMIENINQTIKGIQHINYVQEFEPNLTAEDKQGKKQF